ncbi:MAG: hypothetical protein AAF483_03805 [Planctomycetota bacterium]
MTQRRMLLTNSWLGRYVLCFGVLVISHALHLSSRAQAQLPTVKHDRLGVDLLRMSDGTKLYGFALGKNEDGSIPFAVERSWLEKTHADVFARREASEVSALKQAKQLLKSRVEAWIEERSSEGEKSAGLVQHLKFELRSINFDLDEDPTAPTTMFLLMNILPADLAELKVAQMTNRHIAGIAYGKGLQDVVITPASILRRKLEEMGVDLQQEQVDLADEVPATAVTTEKQWAARQAIYEYHFREPLEYQGTGSTLFRTGEDVDMTALAGQMLAGNNADMITQLGVDLGLPEFKQFKKDPKDKSWSKKITQEAERDGFRGVLVTRLGQSITSSNVSVDVHFFVKESPGKWFELKNFKTTSNVNTQDPNRVDRIKEDPQVKKAMELVGALIPGASNRLDLALQHGAATEQALEDSKGKFMQFLSEHIEDLESPRIEISK